MSAPHIRIAQPLVGFLNQQSEFGISVQQFLGHVVFQRVFQFGNMRAVEQAVHIAVGGHIQGIHSHLFLCHGIHRRVRQVFVFQRQVTDGDGVPHLGRFAVDRFCVIALDAGNGFRLFILPVKEHPHDGDGVIQRPLLAVVIGGDQGDQGIRIVPYFLRVHHILVITWMVQRIVLHFILKLPFQFGVILFRRPYVRFLGGIGADAQRRKARFQQRRAAG